MRIDPEVLNDVIPKFLRDGWQVVGTVFLFPQNAGPEALPCQNVHAIGDRANGLVLDAFEAALADANVSALRPRLEHAQILSQKDMARFGDLGGQSLGYHVKIDTHEDIQLLQVYNLLMRTYCPLDLSEWPLNIPWREQYQ